MKKILCTAFLLLVAVGVRANVTLPDVLTSSMVLQRDRAVPIWGKADPGESVTVSFGNQKKTAAADADGRWIVRLNAMRASATPATMIVAGRNRIELKDILIGEVWLVAGQSNMQRLLSETANGEAAIAAANHPLIRLFNVSRQVAFKHAPPPLGIWRACTPDSVKSFRGRLLLGVELEENSTFPLD
jgi:sialate O-acetylesterase